MGFVLGVFVVEVQSFAFAAEELVFAIVVAGQVFVTAVEEQVFAIAVAEVPSVLLLAAGTV